MSVTDYTDRYSPRAFDGAEYDAEDEAKMARNQARVNAYMVDHIGQWVTPEEVRKGAGLPEHAEVTARLRDMRKPRNGAWLVECRKVEGAYRYRLAVRQSEFIVEGE